MCKQIPVNLHELKQHFWLDQKIKSYKKTVNFSYFCWRWFLNHWGFSLPTHCLVFYSVACHVLLFHLSNFKTCLPPDDISYYVQTCKTCISHPAPLSLCPWCFSTSLRQLQLCPTYRRLPSLHLTACLKEINISAGKEMKASIWCVYLFSWDDKSGLWACCTITDAPWFWVSTVYISFLLSLKHTGTRFIRDRIRGEVTGNDTTEQSFNFSKRLGPLNLQCLSHFTDNA